MKPNDYIDPMKAYQEIIQNLKKTLERYEAENKALRELLKLWM